MDFHDIPLRVLGPWGPGLALQLGGGAVVATLAHIP